MKAGDTYARLTVIREAEKRGGDRYVFCRCKCGTEKVIRLGRLRSGRTKSCGCLKVEVGRGGFVEGVSNRAHPAYPTWCSMINRVENPNNTSFDQYGGRGIKVCKRWRDSFSAFAEDMGDRPKGMSIDRIDNGGDYIPGNCRWATPKQQGRNTRRNNLLEFRGEVRCLSEWSERLGGERGLVGKRLKKGWSVERAITEPVGNRGKRIKA